MKNAFHKPDGATYNAQQFSELPSHEMMEKQPNMACCVCNCYAFYRIPTINGRDACFGSRHVEGCSLASSQTAINQNPNQNLNSFANQTQRIVVDFAYGTVQTDGHTHRQEMPNQLDDDVHSGGKVVRKNIDVSSQTKFNPSRPDCIATILQLKPDSSRHWVW